VGNFNRLLCKYRSLHRARVIQPYSQLSYFLSTAQFLGSIFALSFCLKTLLKFVASTASSVIEKVVWRREGVFGSFTLMGGVIMPPPPLIVLYVTPSFEVEERNGSVTR